MQATTRTSTSTGTRLAMRGPGLIRIDELSRQAGLHPALVQRLFRLGLIEPEGGTAASPLFRRSAVLALRRAVRLRRDLGLNYAGAVLASELLARIDELERRLGDEVPSTQAKHEVIRWIRTG
jgi:chaperone modulatory protein CbpM